MAEPIKMMAHMSFVWTKAYKAVCRETVNSARNTEYLQVPRHENVNSLKSGLNKTQSSITKAEEY